MPTGHGRIKGSADERTQARERVRAELLTAARAIAEASGGFDKVTIRAVADRVGYRAPVVYEYFANKHALLLGLIDLGFAELAEHIGAARPSAAHGRGGDGLLPVALACWEFAWGNPQLYRLMHTLPDVPFGTPDAPRGAVACFTALKAAVDAHAPDHPSHTYDGDAPADLFWAQVHGLVSLALDGRIKGGAPRSRDLLIAQTRAFCAARA